MKNLSLETDGIWRVMPFGLVYRYASLPEYIPNNLEVPFTWCSEYNWGLDESKRRKFNQQYKILEIKEIMEVYGEPINDVDGSFKGRTLLIARFENEADAVFFKMAMS